MATKAQLRTDGTLARAGLADALRDRLGVSKRDSTALVEAILKNMCDALACGETVKISGFGTFGLRDKAERVGRNPKTREEVPITPRRVVTFRASGGLKDRVSGR